ncbi:hypothetical protein PHISP_05064 [Aspergillus sp. HF37]|nr:hypothetical protein PHISP_05064 [Aspergillus sp. HF37]
MFNRIWAAIKREALLTVKEGAASPSEIDSIYKTVTRAPKGPFEQMDVAGLDVILDIEKHYTRLRPGLPSGPLELLQEMVVSGNLGVKSGHGFYDYEADEN